MNRETEVQRAVTRVALARIQKAGFALAGSGAIREHGVIDRPTEDVDLFTVNQDSSVFDQAVEQVISDLRDNGYNVGEVRRAGYFARLRVRAAGGVELDVDMGVDWRENEPVAFAVGPVLGLVDAVGNKVSALYSRGEPRDYLDVDSIRASGRFTDAELMEAASERDAGFEIWMFAEQLAAARRITRDDVERYGVTDEELIAVKDRCMAWAAKLRGETTPGTNRV